MSADHYLTQLPTLFCKPVSVDYPDQFLYNQFETELNATISFRSLQLQTDIDFIHDWVNRSYAKRFWQLDGSRQVLENTYQAILENPNAHSFIGYMNDDPVCQIDIYSVAADELKEHFQYEADDCGLHLLMQPPQKMTRGSSVIMLHHFFRFYFSFPIAKRLFAEPDSENVLANHLAIKAGFHFLKSITMSYKTANLYCITKDEFYAAHPIT